MRFRKAGLVFGLALGLPTVFRLSSVEEFGVSLLLGLG